jgi:hypothetical protein
MEYWSDGVLKCWSIEVLEYLWGVTLKSDRGGQTVFQTL